MFAISAILVLKHDDYSNSLSLESYSFQKTFAVLLLIICLVFLLPLIYLFGSQTKNLFMGMTTSERLSRKSYSEQHKVFEEQKLVNRANAAEQIGNFETYAIDDRTTHMLGLCCNRRVMSQAEIL